MARNSSKQKMGYLKIDEKHHAAITLLVAPATPANRLLDPYAVFNDWSAYLWQAGQSVMLCWCVRHAQAVM
ncbi:MAG: hypothetical protein OHK0046_50500 [Anaerolineae bacterium]